MIDLTTQKPIRVFQEAFGGGPYIMLPVVQVDAVESLLRAHDVSHWTDADSVSLDGKPAIIVINLGYEVDAGRVQRLLDAEK